MEWALCVDRQFARFLINLLLSSGAESNQTMNAGGSSEILVLMPTITRYYSPEECPDEMYSTVK
jgi:hypothetical protein